MGGATTELKVRRDDLGETQTRKIIVSTHIRWEELEEKLRSRFDIGKTDKMVLSYIDEEEETITVSSDEEVADALRNKSQLCFNLMTKKTNKGYNYSE
ncbi:8791_t:CDS:2, partial [Paraglomus occultum]